MSKRRKKSVKQPGDFEYKIFDSSFATMVELFPSLLVPVINEVFGTNYSKDVAVILLRDTHHKKDGSVISDVMVEICGIRYHIECQSTEDGNITIRMLEYDFRIAFDNAIQNKEYAEINMPKSCLVQLRSTRKTSDKLKVKINFHDGNSVIYSAPVIKVNNYSYVEMLEKKLYMLIPYYMMRYEKSVKSNNEIELSKYYEDMKQILVQLKNLMEDDTDATLSIVVELFVKICYYICKSNKTCKERMDKIMNDNPFNLETVRIIRKERAEVRQEDILELLEEYGEVPKKLKKTICEQKEISILRNWLKIAARADSIEEFENEIGLISK